MPAPYGTGRHFLKELAYSVGTYQVGTGINLKHFYADLPVPVIKHFNLMRIGNTSGYRSASFLWSVSDPGN